MMTRITVQNLTAARTLNPSEMSNTQGGLLGLAGLISGIVGSALGLGLRRPFGRLRRPLCRRTLLFGIRCR